MILFIYRKYLLENSASHTTEIDWIMDRIYVWTFH